MLIAGYEHCVKATLSQLNHVDGCKNRSGEVLLVQDVEIRIDRGTAFGQECSARSWTANAKRDDPHIKVVGEILTDALPQTLCESVDSARVKWHRLFRTESSQSTVCTAPLVVNAACADMHSGPNIQLGGG